MVYRSRRRKFNDFVRTGNWKYYLIFLVIFITIVVTVVVLAVKSGNSDIQGNTENVTSSSESESDTEEATVNVKGKYLISINKSNNIISIYEWNSDTEKFSSVPVKEMPAALPADMAEDEYSFNKDDLTKSVWQQESGAEFYRYHTDFGGLFKFHSAMYRTNGNKNSIDLDSYNSIGNSISSNGILLLCCDARWIYENCSYASEIVVISDETADTSAVDSIIPIPDGLLWDPTDTSEDSPFCQTRLKEFNCTIQYSYAYVGDGIDFLTKFVKAYDESGQDVSSYAYTTWNGVFPAEGWYEIPYYIADIYGNIMTDSIKVEVKAAEPETTTSDDEETQETETSQSGEDSQKESTSQETTVDSETSAPQNTEAASES